jgi:hypothetical protein
MIRARNEERLLGIFFFFFFFFFFLLALPLAPRSACHTFHPKLGGEFLLGPAARLVLDVYHACTGCLCLCSSTNPKERKRLRVPVRRGVDRAAWDAASGSGSGSDNGNGSSGFSRQVVPASSSRYEDGGF